jgi:peptidyl-prolyl cis-trans isomerase B (cyclophilin B)
VTQSEKNIDKQFRERMRTYEQRKAEYESRLSKKKRRNFLIISTLVGIVVLAVVVSIIALLIPAPADDSQAETTPSSLIPPIELAEGRVWTGSMNVGNVPLSFELDGVSAPQAVASTIYLAQSGFYEGVTCHRLTTEGIFVLQCGDPNGDGTGGPGYTYGPIENSPEGDLYPAGTIAMARQGGNPTSMGSQFFIVYQDTIIPSDAAGGYTIIGRVTSGLEQLNEEVISQGTIDGSTDGQPAIPVTITSFSVQ